MKSTDYRLVKQANLFVSIALGLAFFLGIGWALTAQNILWQILSVLFALAGVVSLTYTLLKLNSKLKEQLHWYVNILDSIPFPISVTDKNMRWTFVNKPVETLLKKSRADLVGKHCSNWGAGICGTSNCGITCLRNNEPHTTFQQFDRDFAVDSTYLHDIHGRVCGHIEVVQDITELDNMKNLAHLINRINEVSNSLSSGSDQVSSGAQALAQGATQQASAIEELSASVSEISSQVRHNAERAQKAGEYSSAATSAVENSNQQMQRLMVSMNEIDNKSKEISKIIKTIEDIAFQTNILALNAAVEAARAGAAGKGFAVVADEVRNLAGKSAQAAKNTTDLIESSVAAISEGVKIADLTAKDLKELVSGSKETTGLVLDISKATHEQSFAIEQITQGLDQISAVIQANSATSEESASASAELSAQAGSLKELVATFSMGKDVSNLPKEKASIHMPQVGRTAPNAQSSNFGKY